MTRSVISADDVRAARRERRTRIVVEHGAIVTPLARDEAGRWGIELVEGETSAPSKPGPRPGSATCDPDDVERIVEKVRRRVPHADPARIREIARRVLAETER